MTPLQPSVFNTISAAGWSIKEYAGALLKKPLAEIVKEFSNKYFLFARETFFALMGADEYFRLGLRSHKKLLRENEANSVSKVANGYFSGKLKEVESHMISGALYCGSGIFGGLAVLRNNEKLAQSSALFSHVSKWLFFLANIYTLEICVKKYLKARDIMNSSIDPVLKESAKRACFSAITGMVGSLNYIIVTALSYLGAATAFTLVFGCLAGLSAFVKVLYDWFYFDSLKSIMEQPNKVSLDLYL